MGANIQIQLCPVNQSLWFQPSSPERQQAHSQQPKGLQGAEPSPVLAKQGQEHPPPPGPGRTQPRPQEKALGTSLPGPQPQPDWRHPSRVPLGFLRLYVRQALAGLVSASLLEAAVLVLEKDFLKVAGTPPPQAKKGWH